jgi:predicted kinase
VARNARDNLSQTVRFIGGGLAPALHARVLAATEAALARLEPLIEARASRGVPCDTHGDLRLDHVYLFPDRPPPADLVIIDGIEFSPLLRHADPVADAAFLVMDLRFVAEDAAAAALVDAYLAACGDEEGRALFPWYVAYRSAVRAKVDHFTLSGAALSQERRARLEERALGHWLLALAELEPPERRPALLLVGGPPGCGKSTLAAAFAPAHEFAWIRSDAVRRELHSHLGGEERYSPARTAEVYRECLSRADAILREGGRALIDATFHSEAPRREALELGKRRRVPVVHLALSLDRAEALRRIAEHRGDPSEANAAVHDALVAAWEASSAETMSMREGIDARGAPAEVIGRAEGALRRRGLIA